MRAAGEPPIPRKLTVRAGGRKLVLAKGREESERHVLLKALVFARYAEPYPTLQVETRIGGRYKPDLVALDDTGHLVFWAECGEVGRAKIAHLVRHLPDVHLVIAKQTTDLAPYAAMIRAALPPDGRPAPVELLGFPLDAARLISPDGEITADCPDCAVLRLR